MSTIICPYCFKEFKDTDVMFRSAFYNTQDLDNVEMNNRAEAKLFSPDDNNNRDSKYERFWTSTNIRPDGTPGGFATSEIQAADNDGQGNIPAYRRPVINPKEDIWQPYLSVVHPNAYETRRTDEEFGKFLGVNKNNVVDKIILKRTNLHDELTCDMLVCPHCNNPLPGEILDVEKVIKIPVIGTIGSGKTVFLSSLVSNICVNMMNVGYTGANPTGGFFAFRSRNMVERGQPLPDPTPANLVQQPLSFTMRRREKTQNGSFVIKKYMVILYDLAGEFFTLDAIHFLDDTHRKPLLMSADGIILLIDPMQLNVNKEMNYAVSAINVIDSVLTPTACPNGSFNVPLAVCVSKSDSDVFKTAIQAAGVADPDEILGKVNSEPEYTDYKIPADQYNSLSDDIYKYLSATYVTNGILPASSVYNFKRFFAFSATGGARINDVDGKQTLLDVPTPRRIEDPLLWLLTKNGYCEVNGALHHDVRCPDCGSYHTRYEEKTVTVRKHLRKKDFFYNYVCLKCNEPFYVEPEAN